MVSTAVQEYTLSKTGRHEYKIVKLFLSLRKGTVRRRPIDQDPSVSTNASLRARDQGIEWHKLRGHVVPQWRAETGRNVSPGTFAVRKTEVELVIQRGRKSAKKNPGLFSLQLESPARFSTLHVPTIEVLAATSQTSRRRRSPNSARPDVGDSAIVPMTSTTREATITFLTRRLREYSCPSEGSRVGQPASQHGDGD